MLSLLHACAKPDDGAPIVAAAVALPAAAPMAVEVKPQAAGNPDASISDDQTAATAAKAVDAATNYEPPFPDRVDLFIPPKHQGGAVAKAGGEHSVELMGFIRVDRPRAVLAIDGEIKSMAEGDAQFGVEVISVQAPNVVLQRGRQRWQATLD